MRTLFYIILLVISSVSSNAQFFLKGTDNPLVYKEQGLELEGVTNLDLNVYASYNFSDATLGKQTPTTVANYFDLNAYDPADGYGVETIDTMTYVVDNGYDYAWRGYQYDGTYGLINSTPDGGGFELYIDTNLPNDSTEVYYSYNFRMKNGYNPTRGGKLPGIKSTRNSTEGLPCNGWALGMTFTGDSTVYGYEPTAEGVAFYFAVANLSDLDASYAVFDGHCGEYFVAPSSYFYSRVWGWPSDPNAGAPPYIKISYEEQWYNITLRVVRNSSAGVANGIFEGFLNGKFFGRVSGVELETGVGAPSYIDALKFYWFFGGNAENNAPVRDEWADFDDMWVFTFGSTYTYFSGDPPVRGRSNTPNGTILDLPNGTRNIDGSWNKVQR